MSDEQIEQQAVPELKITGLRERFTDLADNSLHERIGELEAQMARTKLDSTERDEVLLELGAALRERFSRTQAQANLERAKEVYRAAFFLAFTKGWSHEILYEAAQFGTELVAWKRYADALELNDLSAQALAAAEQQVDINELESKSRSTRAMTDDETVEDEHLKQHDVNVRLMRIFVRLTLLVPALVAGLLRSDSSESEYERALSALQGAHLVDEEMALLGLPPMDLAQWVRDVSGHDFVELEEVDDWPWEAQFEAHIALKHEIDRNWPGAIATYRKARECLLPDENDEQLAIYTRLGFHLALCLKRAGRWSEALRQQEENVAAYKKLNDELGKANAYLEIGHIYQMMNIYDLALLYYREAYYLYAQVGGGGKADARYEEARRGMASAAESLGKLEFQLRLPRAEDDLWEACKIYQDLDMPDKAASISETLQGVRVEVGAAS